MTRYTLTCAKTGRHWTYTTEGQCRQAARAMGLKDYQIEASA